MRYKKAFQIELNVNLFVGSKNDILHAILKHFLHEFSETTPHSNAN